MTIERIVGEERNVSLGADWVRFLDAGGDVSIAAGTILSIDALPESFSVDTAQQPDMLPGAEYAILIRSTGGGQPTLDSFFALEESESLPGDSWLHPDGTNTERPCAES
ncbi:hypothetical protein V6245_10650 [Salinibacterium amurskyense]|uniref:hypothetical protein n=1 Tax=Salinibacterium amurskyense TaxID=205941 RepID=UPI00311E141A